MHKKKAAKRKEHAAKMLGSIGDSKRPKLTHRKTLSLLLSRNVWQRARLVD
jgi:hypothetical protein